MIVFPEPVMPSEEVQYSERYDDDQFEYRHVTLPPELAKAD